MDLARLLPRCVCWLVARTRNSGVEVPSKARTGSRWRTSSLRGKSPRKEESAPASDEARINQMQNRRKHCVHTQTMHSRAPTRGCKFACIYDTRACRLPSICGAGVSNPWMWKCCRQTDEAAGLVLPEAHCVGSHHVRLWLRHATTASHARVRAARCNSCMMPREVLQVDGCCKVACHQQEANQFQVGGTHDSSWTLLMRTTLTCEG